MCILWKQVCYNSCHLFSLEFLEQSRLRTLAQWANICIFSPEHYCQLPFLYTSIVLKTKRHLYFGKCFPSLLMTFPNIHGMHPVALFRICFRSYEKEPLFKDSFIFFLHSAKCKSEQKPHYGARAV